jgi:hypothetical protein
LISNVLNWTASPPACSTDMQFSRDMSMIYASCHPNFHLFESGADLTLSKTNTTTTVRVEVNGIQRWKQVYWM